MPKLANIQFRKVKCFVCGSQLIIESSKIAELNNPISIDPVYDGLRFRATGNYGSTIFDPCPDDGFIEIIVCDKCVLKKKNQIKRVKNIRYSPPKADTGKFNPRE